MATTISVYQGLGEAFFIDTVSGEPHVPNVRDLPWNPSDDMVRNHEHNNKCLLLWKYERAGGGLVQGMKIGISLNGDSIEEVILGGEFPGMMITGFFSDRAHLGSNTIRFKVLEGVGGVWISDYAVFYQRRPSSIPGN